MDAGPNKHENKQVVNKEFWMQDLEHMMRQSLLDQTIKVPPLP